MFERTIHMNKNTIQKPSKIFVIHFPYKLFISKIYRNFLQIKKRHISQLKSE